MHGLAAVIHGYPGLLIWDLVHIVRPLKAFGFVRLLSVNRVVEASSSGMSSD